MTLVHILRMKKSPTLEKLLGEITIEWTQLELKMRHNVSLLVGDEEGISGVITHAAGFQKWLEWSKELVALRAFSSDAMSDWKITYAKLEAAQKARNWITHAFISSSATRGFNRTQSLVMRGPVDKRTVEAVIGELKMSELREILRTNHEAQVYLSSWQNAYVYGPIGGGPPRLPGLRPRKVVII